MTGLSSLSSSAAASPFQQALASAGQQQQQSAPADKVPGTRTGPTPPAAPAQEPNGVASSTTALEQYKKSADTDPSKQQPKKAELPKYDDFAGIAQQLAGNIKVDGEVAAKALRGDVEALNQLLSANASQVLQQSLYANTAASYNLQQQGVQEATAGIESKVQTTQAQQAARQSVVSAMPQLSSGLGNQLLATTLNQLWTDYPTAPAELIGQEAIRQLQATFGTQQQQPQQAADDETDWSQEFDQ